MVAHSTLTGADLHEVKGAAAASANTVLRADGAGSAQFVVPSTLNNIALTNTAVNSCSVNITPTVVDVPVAATFDANVVNSDINMASTGIITLVTSGVYFTTFNLTLGRTTGAGTAVIVARLLLNGTQFGFTQGVTMDDQLNARTVQFNILRAYSAGDTLQVQIMRDSSGINNGELVTIPVTPVSWGDTPSYWARVSKMVGAS